MPPEHRLTAGAAGLYGKHPGFGDFVAAGLSDAVLRLLGDWLQGTLAAWRDDAGEGWQDAFDAAPRLGFWIGPALTEGLPLRGIMAASRDRTGRRFPLLVAQAGGFAPVLDPAQDFHAAAGQALDDLLAVEGFEPRGAAERLRDCLPLPQDAPQPDWPTFWAVNSQQPPQALLASVAAADHAHAAAARSYWWFAGRTGSGVLACHGLPGPQELGWLIAGGVSDGG